MKSEPKQRKKSLAPLVCATHSQQHIMSRSTGPSCLDHTAWAKDCDASSHSFAWTFR